VEITEVPVISAVTAKKKKEKEIARFRRGSKRKNACHYSALRLALQENISVRSAMNKQEDLEEEERLKKYKSLSRFFCRYHWSVKNREDIEKAIKHFEKNCASERSSIS